jgi:DNA polymerase (family 10)
VGLPWIPPELREDRGELDAAREGRLPRLVTLASIRGDLQMHTTESDGRETLDAMAAAAEAMGYEYIAVTDHSPALRMVRGLDRAGFRRQMTRIDRLNARLAKLTVLRGAEVDIRPDGSISTTPPSTRSTSWSCRSTRSSTSRSHNRRPESSKRSPTLPWTSWGTPRAASWDGGRRCGWTWTGS